MTYKELEKVNSEIKTSDIKGKEYAEVNQRINAFRKLFPNGSITTEIISLEDGVVVMKATATDEEGKVLATGTAYEKEGSSFINKTSFIENCETSCVGRCLGHIGIGIQCSVASYEEVANAMLNQGDKKPENPAADTFGLDKKLTTKQVLVIRNMCNKRNMPEENIYSLYGKASIADMTQADWAKFGKEGQDILAKWDEEHSA